MASRAITGSLPFLLACAAITAAAPAHGQARDWDQIERERYTGCLAKADFDPASAYEDALIWQGEGGGVPARHCVAVALLGLGQTERAAQRLEAAALAPDGGDAAQRTEMLLQAGNAWLASDRPRDAEDAFTQGLVYTPGAPDLLIDRSQAFVQQDRIDEAERDLTDALAIRPGDVRALRLRADVRVLLGRLNEAKQDIDLAVAMAPNDVDTLVVRGRVREAIRVAAR